MKSPVMLLTVIYVTLLPVFEAGQIKVSPEVTAYIGRDVTLPCGLVKGTEDKIVQVQWMLQQPERERISIIVSHTQHGVSVPNTFLKDRVNVSEQSLIIRAVEKRDAGSYTCTLTTFPKGSLLGTTTLVVREQMQLSSGVISAIVICVLLLLGIMAAIAYHMLIRRPRSLVGHQVFVDTDGPVRDVGRPSVLVREQDVVYSDVKGKPSRVAAPSSNHKNTGATHAEDVTYSEVAVSRRLPE